MPQLGVAGAITAGVGALAATMPVAEAGMQERKKKKKKRKREREREREITAEAKQRRR